MSISSENTRLTIIISKETKESLKIIAKNNNRSLSNYVSNLLYDHVQNQTK
ncbi:DUF6364 family protein [Rossellomorea marisflavi]